MILMFHSQTLEELNHELAVGKEVHEVVILHLKQTRELKGAQFCASKLTVGLSNGLQSGRSKESGSGGTSWCPLRSWASWTVRWAMLARFLATSPSVCMDVTSSSLAKCPAAIPRSKTSDCADNARGSCSTCTKMTMTEVSG